ncbi:hypothetical protein MSWAN_0700 [Methanobacterium paludis]|uniref:Uncharacterized protein n=2 Tax=Methanobacterium paludis (strain DSM 25820 / JCM 18151 / SWAN1) TaxID=868131 RepID=F6D6M1_METPW|nr:hypothetical protein MSWAN_0700 [Methanobacterium paludis]
MSMEFKSVSSKLSRDEVTQLRAYCERKGKTTSSFIREIILRELEIPMPSSVAGKNRIDYDREIDRFIWAVDLDSEEDFTVLENVSVDFLEDLKDVISRALDERAALIGKKNENSVAVPSRFLRRE